MLQFIVQHKGSGNESGIFDVMLDKSTYFKNFG